MSTVSEILNSTAGTPQRLQALKKFNAQHAGTQAFGSFMSSSEKSNLVQNLTSVAINLATDQLANPEFAESCIALRLLAREDSGLKALISTETLTKFVEAAGLKNPESIDFGKMSSSEITSRSEATKLLINMLLRTKEKDLTKDFENLGALKALLTVMTDLLARNRENYDWIGSAECDSILFPLTRLWFNVARPIPENEKMIQLALSEGGITLIGEWLERLLHPKSASGRQFPNHLPMALSDLVRVLVGLTIDMGPLGQNKKELLVKHIPNFQSLVNTLMNVLDVCSEVNGAADDPNVEIKHMPLLQFALVVASALVNVPVEFAKLLLRDNTPRAALTLHNLFSQQIYHQSLEGVKGLAPHMMLMATIAKADRDVRKEWLKLMFPHRNIDTEDAAPAVHAPGKEVKCVGNEVINLMTHFDMAVKYWSNELLFQMCDENPDRFVKLTGFGNAAGLLVMRNMFGMGRHLNDDTASQMREARKQEQENAAPASSQAKAAPSSTTGATSVGSGGGIDLSNMDEEEMERLAKKLMMMEEKGLVKLVRKGDKEGEELVRQYQAKQAAAPGAGSSSSSSSQTEKKDEQDDDKDKHRDNITPSER